MLIFNSSAPPPQFKIFTVRDLVYQGEGGGDIFKIGGGKGGERLNLDSERQ